jgi:hypothetical protein
MRERQASGGLRWMAIAIAGAVVAAATGVLLLPRVFDSAAKAPEAAQNTPVTPTLTGKPSRLSRPSKSGAVWADDNGIHLGDGMVGKVPFTAKRNCPQEDDGICPRFTSLALVAGGVVYGEASTLRVWYQPWTGAARVIGQGSRYGPGGDPDGTTAAWFEDANRPGETRRDEFGVPQWDLVMFDTATGTATAKVTQKWGPTGPPEGRLTPTSSQYEHAHGNQINDVTPTTVTWNGYWTFDRLTGVTSPLPSTVYDPALPDRPDRVHDVHAGLLATTDDPPEGVDPAGVARVVSPAGDITWKSQPEQFDSLVLQFSADGRYLAGVTPPDKHYGAVVADTRTGALFIPSNDVYYPWIGWGYDDTLMVIRDETRRYSRLLACDVSKRSCQRFTVRGHITLPNGG